MQWPHTWALLIGKALAFWERRSAAGRRLGQETLARSFLFGHWCGIESRAVRRFLPRSIFYRSGSSELGCFWRYRATAAAVGGRRWRPLCGAVPWLRSVETKRKIVGVKSIRFDAVGRVSKSALCRTWVRACHARHRHSVLRRNGRITLSSAGVRLAHLRTTSGN